MEKEGQVKKRGRGKGKGKVPTIQKTLHLSVDVAEAIESHATGNQSSFVDKILRMYLEYNDIIKK